MSQTTIRFKVRGEKNSYGGTDWPEFTPASEADHILACHILPSTGQGAGQLWTHQCPDANGKPGELRGNLQLLYTLAEAHGWEVKFIHDEMSERPPHPIITATPMTWLPARWHAEIPSARMTSTAR
jgi:hypothetical protein